MVERKRAPDPCVDIVYTPAHVAVMASNTSRSSGAPVSDGFETRGSINLRIGTSTRELIDEAAAILGKTRTDFMIESARREAIDVVLDRRLFELDPERYDAFLAALDNPPAAGPKLRSLLSRVPAWKR